MVTVVFNNFTASQLNEFDGLFTSTPSFFRKIAGSALLSFHLNHLKHILEKTNEFSMGKTLAEELRILKSLYYPGQSKIWRFQDRQLNLSNRTYIMGILNITPDSFSDGGSFIEPEHALTRALQMIEEGADIIDIGGESSRPGSVPVTIQEEMNRVIPVIESLRKYSHIPISIDSYKSEVARTAIQAGANIVNDISGLRFDEKLVDIVNMSGTGLILMHIKGTPQNMQISPFYTDVIEEILNYLTQGIDQAIEADISDEQLIIDPGIGFGKRWFDNYEILNRLQELKILRLPILVGISRKSFIGKVIAAEPLDRLEGSLSATCKAVLKGASIIRTHDIIETKKAVTIADVLLHKEYGVSVNELEAHLNE